VELLGSGHELGRISQLSEGNCGCINDALSKSLTLGIECAEVRVENLEIYCR
jgi:hypothetical protein